MKIKCYIIATIILGLLLSIQLIALNPIFVLHLLGLALVMVPVFVFLGVLGLMMLETDHG